MLILLPPGTHDFLSIYTYRAGCSIPTGRPLNEAKHFNRPPLVSKTQGPRENRFNLHTRITRGTTLPPFGRRDL